MERHSIIAIGRRLGIDDRIFFIVVVVVVISVVDIIEYVAIAVSFRRWWGRRLSGKLALASCAVSITAIRSRGGNFLREPLVSTIETAGGREHFWEIT